MQVLLRNVKTGFFVHSEASWTSLIHWAHTFQASAAARDFVARHQLQDIEMLFYFRGFGELTLPTGVRPQPPPARTLQNPFP